MKLKSARIQNFKLLRDVQLEFSQSRDASLTVIRAENGSGKTSTLVALRWVLYGASALDDAAIRLSPADWAPETECEVKVQLDFSHTLYNHIAGEFVPTTTNYRLLRTATERPEGDRPNRKPDRIALYQITDRGMDLLDSPEILIAQMLPLEMRDIFFTDGDAALSFISPQLTPSSKRDQVRDAIRSLLGLGLLEGAAKHIANAKKQFNSAVSVASDSSKLAEVAKEHSETEEALERDLGRIQDVDRQIEELARRHDDADKRLQIALQAGNHSELAAQKEQAQTNLRTAKASESVLKNRHQQLLQDQRVATCIMNPLLMKGFSELALLHEAGVIPSGSIPVLRERIEMGVCICGAELIQGSDARAAVVELVERQKTVDSQKKALTELHHAASVDLQMGEHAAHGWLADLSDLETTRLNNRRAQEAAQSQLKVCEEKLARVDEARVEETRQSRDSLRVSLNARQDERRELQIRIDQAQERLKSLIPELKVLRQQDTKLSLLNSQVTVADDVALIVDGALEDIQQRYLGRVSDRMNELFLEMVGADPSTMGDASARERGRVFSSASITDAYEIAVLSGEGNTLNPDYELNGASKRALTFAFIWALTEVAGLTAPRIIDTPLGMMSGAVKKRVLELITAASPEPNIEKQVVLFLTRDELRGIEDIVDTRAGNVFTYTNTDHFPVDLVNDPRAAVPEISVCLCNHRHVCDVCSRRNDDQYGLLQRLSVRNTP